MNIDMPLKTETNYLKYFLLFAFVVLSRFYLLAQETDTIIPIQQDPEKILRKIHVKSITRNGFNFWQDKFSGHWAGVDLGFNALLFPDYSGYQTEFMKNNLFRSNSLYVNLIQQSIGLQHNRNTIGMVTGLGMQFQSYRLDKNTTIERQPDGTIVPKELYFDDNQKSKLSMFYLTLPVLVEFQIPINHYENRLYISSGVYMGYRVSSHTKIKYRTDKKQKLKVPDNYSLHDFKYGFMVRTGYRWINVFATYDFTNLFYKEKGPELTPFIFGITLLRF